MWSTTLASESVWLPLDGALVRISLSADRWINRACEAAGRNLMPAEWDRSVTGGGEPVPACGGDDGS